MPDKIRIIGVPMDLGASRRGVDMGPSALRVAGLQARLKQLGRHVEDIGNVSVPQPEEQPYGEKRARYLDEISSACKGLADAVKKALDEDFTPLVLGGDHSVAVGTTAGTAAHFHKKGKRIGVIWLDAHGDMNTPDSSPSGNVHGMPLASIMGYGPPELTDLAGIKPMVEPRNVALVGIRELDSKERRLVKESGVHIFTMRDIDERGMREVMADALRFAGDDTAGTPVRGGVTYREAHLALEMIADSKLLASFELVEINPVIDVHNTTAALGVELVLSGLGKKIL
jgi:arginase